MKASRIHPVIIRSIGIAGNQTKADESTQILGQHCYSALVSRFSGIATPKPAKSQFSVKTSYVSLHFLTENECRARGLVTPSVEICAMKSKVMSLASVVLMLSLSSCAAVANRQSLDISTQTNPSGVSATQTQAEQNFKSELRLKLLLERTTDGWTVVQTDTVTDAEAAQPGHLAAFEAGFTQPDAKTKEMLTSALNPYVSDRMQAVVSHDINFFWHKYPTLQHNRDANTGVNAEADVVNLYRDSYRDFKLTGGSIGLEAYKPLKAKVSGDRAEVVVHGFESYSLKQR